MNDDEQGMKWVEELPERRRARWPGVWRMRLAPLVERPGVWAAIKKYRSNTEATGTASRLRLGRLGGAGLDRKEYEFVAREKTVYARYVGKEEA